VGYKRGERNGHPPITRTANANKTVVTPKGWATRWMRLIVTDKFTGSPTDREVILAIVKSIKRREGMPMGRTLCVTPRDGCGDAAGLYSNRFHTHWPSTDFTLFDLLILWFCSRLLLSPNFFPLLAGLIRSYSSLGLLDTTDILCALFTHSPQDIG